MHVREFYTTSTESISYQTDTKFTTRLDDLSRRMLEESTISTKHANELSSVLYDRFGIRFNVVVKRNISVEIPAVLDTISPKYGVKRRSNDKAIVERSNAISNFIKKGKLRIDTGKAYITLPKQVTIRLSIDTSILKELGLDKEPRNLSAIILHEVGHIFDYFESLNTVMRRSNQYVDTIIPMITSGSANSKKIIKTLELDKNSEASKLIEQAAKSGSRFGLSYAVGKAFEEILYAVPLSSSYTANTSTEVAADSFSARFGYSKELAVTTVALTTSRYGTEYKNNIIFATINIMLQAISLFIYALIFSNIGVLQAPALFFMVVVAAINALYIILVAIYTLGGRRATGATSPYPTLKDRLNAIRTEVIRYANNAPSLDKAQIEQVLDSIDAVDQATKKIGSTLTVYEKMASVLFITVRKEETYIKFEQMLQDLANNNLTVSALKLELSLMDG